jgi:hypothetical protein
VGSKLGSLKGENMKYCPKHDIHGDVCWCCEEQEINAKGPEHRAKMYRDPAFLQKRGGSNAAVQAQSNAVVARLSQLDPDQLERLISFATSGGAALPAGAGKRTIAIA